MQGPQLPLSKLLMVSKLKIAIIGKGTAGCLTALYFSKLGCEIDWYYDSKKSSLSVGESSTLSLPKFLEQFHIKPEHIKATHKIGVNKQGWTYNSFNHDFIKGFGLHIDAHFMQEYISNLLKYKVNVVDREITNIDDIDATLVIDCSGTPKNHKELIEIDCIPVNSCYLVNTEWDYPQFERTETHAKKNGWMFGIPLQNRVSRGYLFNSNISSVKEIQEEMQEGKLLTFNSYVRKQNFHERVVYNGNASFFLEPIEATSIQFILDLIKLTGKKLLDNKLSDEQCNIMYHKFVSAHKHIIMCHYLNGSIYRSEFWDYAKGKAQGLFNSEKTKEYFSEIYGSKIAYYSHWQKWNWDLHGEHFNIDFSNKVNLNKKGTI